jgi:hypothetical protein
MVMRNPNPAKRASKLCPALPAVTQDENLRRVRFAAGDAMLSRRMSGHLFEDDQRSLRAALTFNACGPAVQRTTGGVSSLYS